MVQQHRLDLGHVPRTEDRVGLPVHTSDTVPVEDDLFSQCPTGRLQARAFELVAETGGVDDLPDIGGDDGTL